MTLTILFCIALGIANIAAAVCAGLVAESLRMSGLYTLVMAIGALVTAGSHPSIAANFVTWAAFGLLLTTIQAILWDMERIASGR